MNTESDFLCKR